jgi:hypothetical protein
VPASMAALPAASANSAAVVGGVVTKPGVVADRLVPEVRPEGEPEIIVSVRFGQYDRLL